MDENLTRLSIAELERLQFRAQCKVRCLDASIDRISFSDFEQTMSQLEAAKDELDAISLQLIQARRNSFKQIEVTVSK